MLCRLFAIITFFGYLANGKEQCDTNSFKIIKLSANDGLYSFKISTDDEQDCTKNAVYDWTLYKDFGSQMKEVPESIRALKHYGLGNWTENEVDTKKITAMNFNPKYNRLALKVRMVPDSTQSPISKIYRIDLKEYLTENLRINRGGKERTQWLNEYQTEDLTINGGKNRTYWLNEYQTENLTISGDKERTNWLNEYQTEDLTISGGKERTHWLNDSSNSLWLNATGLADEENLNSSNVQWTCDPPFAGVEPPKALKWLILSQHLKENMTHKCAIAVGMGKVKSIVRAAQVIHTRGIQKVVILCRDNCQAPNPIRATIFSVRCIDENCDPLWSVEPSDRGYMEGSDAERKGEIKFKENTFDFNKTVTIIATVGKYNASYTIHFKIAEPRLEITCIVGINCEDTSREIQLKVNCDNECKHLDYYWEINPIPKKTWSLNLPTNNIITFPANSFNPGTSVQLWVSAGKSHANYSLHTIPLSRPKLSVTCVTNCTENDPEEPLELRVDCKANCDNFKQYRWELKPPPHRFHWYDHTRKDNTTLLIPGNNYKDGDSVTITAYAGEGSDGITISYSVEYPRMKISCIQNCREGSVNNPHLPATLEVTCFEGCRKKPYFWHLEPQPANKTLIGINKDPDGTLFLIPAELYKEGDAVNVTVAKGNGLVGYSFQYGRFKPSISITCVKNCVKNPDPLQDTELEVICTENCSNLTLNWQVAPPPKSWQYYIALTNKNRTMTVKATAYNGGVHPSFNVTTKYGVEAHLTIFYEYLPVSFYIECEQNCNNSWTSQNVLLQVKCLENCRNVGFIWSLVPDNLDWKKSTIMSTDNTTLTILPNTFKGSEIVTFKAKVVFKVRDASLGDIWKESNQESSINITFEESFRKRGFEIGEPHQKGDIDMKATGSKLGSAFKGDTRRAIDGQVESNEQALKKTNASARANRVKDAEFLLAFIGLLSIYNLCR